MHASILREKPWMKCDENIQKLIINNNSALIMNRRKINTR